MKKRKIIFKRVSYLLMIISLITVVFSAPTFIEKEVNAVEEESIKSVLPEEGSIKSIVTIPIITRGNWTLAQQHWTLAQQYVFTTNEPIIKYSLDGGDFIAIDPPVDGEYTIAISDNLQHQLVLKDADSDVSEAYPIEAKATGNDNLMFYASKGLLPWDTDSNWEYSGTGSRTTDILYPDGNCKKEYGEGAACYKIYELDVDGEQVKVLQQLDYSSTVILQTVRQLDQNDYNNLYSNGGSVSGRVIVPSGDTYAGGGPNTDNYAGNEQAVDYGAYVELEFGPEMIPNRDVKSGYNMSISSRYGYVQIITSTGRRVLDGSADYTIGDWKDVDLPLVRVGDPLDFEIRIPKTGERGLLPPAEIYINEIYIGAMYFLSFGNGENGAKVRISSESTSGTNSAILIENFGIEINTNDIDVSIPVFGGANIVDNPIYTFKSNEKLSGYQVNNSAWVTIEPTFQITDILLIEGLNDLRVRDISGNIATYTVNYHDTTAENPKITRGNWTAAQNYVLKANKTIVEYSLDSGNFIAIDPPVGDEYTITIGDTAAHTLVLRDSGYYRSETYLIEARIGYDDLMFYASKGLLPWEIDYHWEYGGTGSITPDILYPDGNCKKEYGEGAACYKIYELDVGGEQVKVLQQLDDSSTAILQTVRQLDQNDYNNLYSNGGSVKGRVIFPSGDTYAGIWDPDTDNYAGNEQAVDYGAYVELQFGPEMIPNRDVKSGYNMSISSRYGYVQIITSTGRRVLDGSADYTIGDWKDVNLPLVRVGDPLDFEIRIPKTGERGLLPPAEIYINEIYIGAMYFLSFGNGENGAKVRISSESTSGTNKAILIENFGMQINTYDIDILAPLSIGTCVVNHPKYTFESNEKIAGYQLNHMEWYHIEPTFQLIDLPLHNGLNNLIVRDISGNISSHIIDVDRHIFDIPIIKPIYGEVLIMEYGSNWAAPTTMAYDNEDGDISDDIVITYHKADGTTSIDLTVTRAELTAGNDVVVKYNVSDTEGNKAMEVSAIFSTDTTKPVINPVTGVAVDTEAAATWEAPDATITDNNDANFTVEGQYYKPDGTSIDLATARTELAVGRSVVVKYNATDNAGNIADEVKATFTTGADKTKPVINPVTGVAVDTESAATWKALDATVTDNIDADFTVEGQYYKPDGTLIDLATARTALASGIDVVVKYNVTDNARNIADEVEATFTTGADKTKPVIDPVDDTTVETEDVATWITPTATANDNKDGIINEDIVVTYYIKLLDEEAARTELAAGRNVVIKYNVSDIVGNEATEVSAIAVASDTTVPVIAPVADAIVDIDANPDWKAPDAPVTDNKDEDFTATATYFKADDLDTKIGLVAARTELAEAGNKIIVKYNATDAAGNKAVEVSATFTAVAPTDTTVPVIDQVDDVTVNTGDASGWTAPDAPVTDNVDEDFTATATYFKADNLDTEIGLAAARTELEAGNDVLVKYNATDAAGNHAVEVSATFTAEDNTVPVIEQVADATVNTGDSSGWTAPDAPVTDNVDEDFTATATYFKADDLDTEIGLAAARAELEAAGNKVVVKYNVTDAAGNKAVEVSATFTAVTSDTTLPVINPVDDADVNIGDASSWTTPKATANDTEDGNISDDIVVTYYKEDGTPLLDEEAARIELGAAGNKVIVKYNVTDATGNKAVEVSATFTAITPDITLPVITAPDDADVNIGDASSWTTPKATANDTEDGNISDDIVVTYYKEDGTPLLDEEAARIELGAAGNKVIVKYNVTDATGNKAVEVSATFTAVTPDTTLPVIYPVDDATVNTENASSWITPTAIANDTEDGNISDDIVVTYYKEDGTQLLDEDATRIELRATGNKVIVKYNVTDAAGNKAVEVSATFTAVTPDTTPPIIISSGFSRTLEYTIKADEKIGEYSINNGATWTQVTTPSDNVTITFLANGVYQIKVKDVAGNESAMKSVKCMAKR